MPPNWKSLAVTACSSIRHSIADPLAAAFKPVLLPLGTVARKPVGAVGLAPFAYNWPGASQIARECVLKGFVVMWPCKRREMWFSLEDNHEYVFRRGYSYRETACEMKYVR
jgi:hypothetical protein